MTITQTINHGERIDYTTKETAAFIREALKKAFPGVKFSVRTSYASMTSSTHIRWTDGPTRAEVEMVSDRFSSRGFDGMTDCTTYHDQEVDGRRVHYSGWIDTQREVSAALLQKALDRYNRQRAEYGFGPAAVAVVADAKPVGMRSMPYLDGPDRNEANPCGGRATWITDAVHEWLSVMRPDGMIVRVKR